MIHFKSKCYWILCLALLFVTCQRRSPGNELAIKFTDILGSSVEQFNIPGLAVAITRNDSIIYSNAFGSQNLDARKPLEIKHNFHFASVSKPFVATAVMQLVEQGRLSLDDRITAHLPYFRLNDERHKDITIRQVLNHTSGLGDVHDYEWDNPQTADTAAEKFVRGLTDHEMIFDPGEDWAYSNLGYDMLGDLIAKVSGMSFETYIKRHIFDPLQMGASSFIYSDIPNSVRTLPYTWEGAIALSEHYPYNRIHAPSSTLNTNVIDMCNWTRANLNRGKFMSARILEATHFDTLWHNSVDIEGRPKVGLSWFLKERHGRKIILHSGGDTGYCSFVMLIPEENISIILASNFELTLSVRWQIPYLIFF